MPRQRVISAARRALGRAAPTPPQPPPVDREGLALTDVEREIVSRSLQLSLTSRRRILANVDAVRYCVDRDIPGAIVECGVWRGGSAMSMLLALRDLGREDRDVYLYDTYEGMTEPTEHDISPLDGDAREHYRAALERGEPVYPEFFDPETFNEEIVRRNVLSTGYPEAKVHFVRGRVEETLPEHAPEQIALLRLDTDWYESTLHELVHLYPRLAPGGVLIIDDYGHWEGARRAVEEYFAEQGGRPLLHRVDYAARMGIKT